MQQFPSVKGLSLTLYQRKKCGDHFIKNCIQIVHSCSNDEVLVFDSLYDNLDDTTKSILIQICFHVRTSTWLHARSKWDFMIVVSL